MKANDVYRKTIKFVWLKLALGGCAIIFSIVLGLILLGISALSQNDGVLREFFPENCLQYSVFR